jgi:hypothetical protein
MSHACSAFAVAAFLTVWLRVRERWSVGGCAALGALAALMAMVREQDVFIALGPIVDWAWSFLAARRLPAPGARDTGSERRAPGAGFEAWGAAARLAAAAAAFLLAYAPQLWAYTVLNGYPAPSRLVARKMSWTSPHAVEVLFSPAHGLVFWTPLVLLALAGLGVMAAQGRRGAEAQRDRRRIALCLLIAVASQVYVAGAVESWTVAGAFGQRRFLGLTLVFGIGLAALWSRVSGRAARTAMAIGVATAVWWNLGLTAQFGTGLMDRQRLEPARNAWHTFVTIPARLPDLAYRYVFARSSFYKAPANPEP